MESRVLELLLDYSTRGKLADRDFVDILINIVVSYKNLSDYIDHVDYVDLDNPTDKEIRCASYNVVRKQIQISNSGIYNVLNAYNIYDSLFDNLESYMFKNIQIAKFVLHELEHAYQYKLTDDKNNNATRNKLLRACFFLEDIVRDANAFMQFVLSVPDMDAFMKEYKQTRDGNYDFCPSERMAEIGCQSTILNTLSMIRSDVPNLYDFESTCLDEKYLTGYAKAFREGGCPSGLYLKAIKQDDAWKSMDFYSDNYDELVKNVVAMYSLTSRVTMGLPASIEECNLYVDRIMNSRKYKIDRNSYK